MTESRDYFAKCCEFVLKWEGGETYDTGGHTKYGISKKAYPDVDIANLTLEQAKEIYKRDYWERCGCPALCYPECLVVFDTAVNCGVSLAKEWMRQADQIGYREILLKRIEHYTNLARSKRYAPYFRGWMNRVMDLYRVACED